MRKEMTVVDKLQRTFNNLPQEKKDRINRILENYEETVFSTPHEPNNEDRLEQEITTLREQVDKLTEECVVLRASARSKFETIATLEQQVEKLTKERDDLRSRRCEVCGYLEHEREHTGCLREQVDKLTEAYDQCGRTVQEYGKTIDQTESRLREVAAHCANVEQQLSALAEQNGKFRETLSRWRYQNLSYNWCCGNCGAVEGDEHKEGCALSLPNLTPSALNRKKENPHD